MKEKVWFAHKTIKIVGEIYYPDQLDESKKYPSLVVVHPGGGVKEQVAGLYAARLSEKGFVALAYDASHQGESGGEPRFLEDPYTRVEDIRSAIDYLVTLPYVDVDRLGVLGICAGGGYAMSAAQTEYRIKAVAGVSSWDIGGSAREGFGGGLTSDDMKKTLEAVAAQRTKEAQGEPVLYVPYVPEIKDMDEKTPTIFREGYDYYRTPRAQHPNSKNKMMFTSLDRIMSFFPFSQIETISPRPLLFIVGSAADSAYFSEQAYEKAKEPKELFKVEGATHISLYDKPEHVGPAVEKLTAFFQKNL